MMLFLVSMATWHEGRRFVSRKLAPKETKVVSTAMKLWSEIPEAGHLDDCRALVSAGQVFAMHPLTFVRAQERATFGYTSEHGRILLNPWVCFGQQQMSGSFEPSDTDVVATLATLYHETHHLRHGATEEVAYEAEWRLVQTGREWAIGESRRSLAAAFADWEEEMPSRIQLAISREALVRVQTKVRASHGLARGCDSTGSMAR